MQTSKKILYVDISFREKKLHVPIVFLCVNHYVLKWHIVAELIVLINSRLDLRLPKID